MQVNAYKDYRMTGHQAFSSPKSKTSFADCMAATTARNTSEATEAVKSGHVRIDMLDYLEWRKTREPINIPNTDGWTEENIQYLKSRYPGELSPYERLEALRTMANMGCITSEEYQKAIGTDKEIVVCDARETTCISGRLEDDGYSPYLLMQSLPRVDWAETLKDLTISKANTLDELFDLLDAGSKSKVSGN